jgi:WD40 repeat protein
VYDQATGTWTTSGSLTNAHALHTATLLGNGKVLVAAGGDNTNTFLASAELYDPGAGTWTMTGSLNSARKTHTATLLNNGKVLIAGGYNATSVLASAELYDPATETWTSTGALNAARDYHAATLLPNGKVLVTGGNVSSPGGKPNAELYDPATGAWTAATQLSTSRAYHKATLLPNGKVLVSGGFGVFSFTALSSAEVYDPATGTWVTTAGAMATPRYFQAATLLPNGQVLVTGGTTGSSAISNAELFDPATGVIGFVWRPTGSMSTARYSETTTLLPDGRVLVAGGYGAGVVLASTELYDVGLGFSPSWRPQIATLTTLLSPGTSLAITGSQFRGIAGGSGGNTQDSPADYPLVQLRSLDSERTVFLLSTDWFTNSFASAPLARLPSGYALATVFVNSIPSTGSVINVSTPVPTPPALTDAKILSNGSFQFAFTNSPGALFGVLAATNLALPASNWTALGGVTEVSLGHFQFSDPQATNNPQRFYRVRAP